MLYNRGKELVDSEHSCLPYNIFFFFSEIKCVKLEKKSTHTHMRARAHTHINLVSRLTRLVNVLKRI